MKGHGEICSHLSLGQLFEKALKYLYLLAAKPGKVGIRNAFQTSRGIGEFGITLGA